MAEDVGNPEVRFEVVRELVLDAYDCFRKNDLGLLETTERAVAARLLIYLDALVARRPVLVDYTVDFEYERTGAAIKGFAGLRAADDSGHQKKFRRKIVPDLLIHRRMINDARSNLLAIEVKTNPRVSVAGDRAKLNLLTNRHAWAEVRPLGRHGGNRLILGGGDRPRDVDTAALPRGINPYAYGVLIRLSAGTSDPQYEWFFRQAVH